MNIALSPWFHGFLSFWCDVIKRSNLLTRKRCRFVNPKYLPHMILEQKSQHLRKRKQDFHLKEIAIGRGEISGFIFSWPVRKLIGVGSKRLCSDKKTLRRNMLRRFFYGRPRQIQFFCQGWKANTKTFRILSGCGVWR